MSRVNNENIREMLNSERNNFHVQFLKKDVESLAASVFFFWTKIITIYTCIETFKKVIYFIKKFHGSTWFLIALVSLCAPALND